MAKIPKRKHRHGRRYRRFTSDPAATGSVQVPNSVLTDEVIEEIKRLHELDKTPKKQRGLYARWYVKRVNDPTAKHTDCKIVVLDVTHDPHAAPAIFSYARSLQADGYGQLAADLYGLIQPFIEKLNLDVQLGSDEEVDSVVDLLTDGVELQALSDVQLVHCVVTDIWAKLENHSAESLLLQELLDRLDRYAPKQVNEIIDAENESKPN